MNQAADLITARAAISAVQQRFLTATDDELLADTGLIEEIGRMVDGLRVAAAAEIEHRSRPLLGVERLSFRSGAKDGVQLVEHITRVSHREAKRRVGIGAAIAPRRGLLSETLPSRLPDVTDAVNTGMIGLDAARVIVELWKETRLRAEPAELGTAVQALVHTAQVVDVDGVKEVAAQWRLAIDPSGAKPIEQQRHRSRALRIGDTLEDGTTRVSAIMLPEHLALLREFLQAARRSTPLVRTEAGSEHPDEPLEPEWREDGTDPDIDDPRSKAQQDYDTLVDGIALAAKAQAAGFAGTSTTHQVVITVTADELAKREGHGWAPGLMVGLPMPTVEQIACTAETRLQVDGANGEPLFLSRTHRLFTPAQKLSLITSAGGRWPVRVARLHDPGAVPRGAPRGVVQPGRRPDGRGQRDHALQPSPPRDPCAEQPGRDPAVGGRPLHRPDLVDRRSRPEPAPTRTHRGDPGADPERDRPLVRGRAPPRSVPPSE